MLQTLVDTVRRYTERSAGENPYITAIEGLTILRSDHEKSPSHLIFKPSLCVVLQGAKSTRFGSRQFDYHAGQALIVSVEMPAFSRVTLASPEQPYLGLVIELDQAIMSEISLQCGISASATRPASPSVLLTEFAGPLTECVLRMVRLLETPQAIATLAPMIMREIAYWLLHGPEGAEVARIMLGNDHTQRVVKAIHSLRDNFRKKIRIEELALIAQLSPSAFHRQFKTLTSLTPLQYQKKLRLLEARHLLLSGENNAETTAFHVGYESPSQFSREYHRMFGLSPRQDRVKKDAR
ncbi:helix-turn-helix domain-containing protein [Paramixta manurensis]|uniref:Helix-turn-helix domain-containing protein n=1 Tax=Paramixta manurensis TaxID=2740817 RepID=A0A6M8UDK6_9GAMM|nr:helix-turn-helix domain-containing protein [Erwiniaceae bacterium PD-1]